MYQEVLILIASIVCFGLIGMMTYKVGFKYRRWSEWIVFWLLGPCLTLGIQFSVGIGFDMESLALGVLTGWLSVFYIHLKNFEQLLVNEKANFQNTMTWLGFERGRKWLCVWWLAYFILQTSYHYFYSDLVWRFIFSGITALLSVFFFFKVIHLKSPVGSSVSELFHDSRKMIYAVMGVWIIYEIWTL